MLDRRTFLYASAATAGAAMLAACSSGEGGGTDTGSGGNQGGGGNPDAKGSATKPLSKPAKFQEAPMLKSMVDAGDIPALAERLPDNPYVIPHKWVKPGKFGGKLLMISKPGTGGPVDASVKEYMYGHTLMRYLNDGLDIGPGLVESLGVQRRRLRMDAALPHRPQVVRRQAVDDRRHHVLVGGHGAQRGPHRRATGRGAFR